MNAPRSIEIMDTTLRDGEQTHNVSFAPAEKLHIARILLEKVQVDRIEVANARVSEGEKQALSKITSWAREQKNQDYIDRIEVLGLVDGGKSIQWISESGGTVINLLTKGSLKHLTGQLKKTPEQHFKAISAEIQHAKNSGVSVNVYLEDWSNGYINSPDYVYDITAFLRENNVKRVMLPDTLGIFYPTQVRDAILDMTERFPDVHFDYHPHNDYGLGTVNSLEALRAGARGVHATVNTLGERTGNASLAEVVASVNDHLKFKTRVVEKTLFSISRIVETFSGKRLSANSPVVGEDVFTQTAGIHADGDKKGGLYHNPLLPQRFGRKRSYSLGKLSGKASLEQNLANLGIVLSDDNLKKVLARIIQLGDTKKIVTIDDLPFIISDVLKKPLHKEVDIQQLVITSGKDFLPVCSMQLLYKEKEYRVHGSGDGGYDAFFQALISFAKASGITLPSLTDYQIRIPPGGKTSALVECSITWETKEGTTISTRGIDSDQTVAAVRATERMLNKILDPEK